MKAADLHRARSLVARHHNLSCFINSVQAPQGDWGVSVKVSSVVYPESYEFHYRPGPWTAEVIAAARAELSDVEAALNNIGVEI